MEKENAEMQSRLEKENALLREQLDASKSGLQVSYRLWAISYMQKIAFLTQWMNN